MKSPIHAYDRAVIGGDMRQVYLAEELTQLKKQVCHYALCKEPREGHRTESLFHACQATPVIICPIPFSKNGDDLNQSASAQALPIEQLLSHLSPGQTLFAGCIPKRFRGLAEEKGVRVHDLMENVQLALFNTLATAEGAICEAIKRSPVNLHHSACAVLGYGKCGRTLAAYLKGMFCSVHVYSDQPGECAQAALVADQTGDLEAFDVQVKAFDFVFNTIPAPVLGEETLRKMKQSVTIIDIASAPGGVDFAAAQEQGLDAVLCPGLPGKYAPFSSARAVREAIERILKE